jgi:hypothetical protein
MKELTVREKETYRQYAKDVGSDEGKAVAMIATMALVDESGERVFTTSEEDQAFLLGLSASVGNRICEEYNALNGSVEESKKNSAQTQT